MVFIFWKSSGEVYDLGHLHYLNGIFGDPESGGWTILKQTTIREIRLSLSLSEVGGYQDENNVARRDL